MASPLSPLVRSVRVALTPQILLMVSKVYIPVLFPVTFLIALTALNLDRAFGFANGFLPTPVNYAVAGASLVLGLLVVGITYAELVFRGEGSPSPTAGRTMKLVRSGIYAYCRNPSVHGKLLGVLAVGFALNSFSFCFVLVPVLLTLSLIEKVVRQEPQLVEIFGDEYEDYRKEVPLFIPWKIFHSRRKV
jgi:protein-S-isoprenylcysteine O-methyltransferase Ste14